MKSPTTKTKLNEGLSTGHCYRPLGLSQTVIARTITGLMMSGLLLILSGCMKGEQEPDPLQITIEAQTIQMAAISDRLARCEHQWQLNVNELSRNNQMTYQDLIRFNEEQIRLRESVQDMDERWETKHDHLRNRQGQVQQSVTDLNKTIASSDAQIMSQTHQLEKKIATHYGQLSAEVKTLNQNDASFSKQVRGLQKTTKVIKAEIYQVQNQNQELKTVLTAKNSQLATQIDAASTQTINKLAQVDSKQDHLLGWTYGQDKQQTQGMALDSERHAALNGRFDQLQKDTRILRNHVSQVANQQSSLGTDTQDRLTHLNQQQTQLLTWTETQNQKQTLQEAINTGRQETVEDRLHHVAELIQNRALRLSQDQSDQSQQTSTDLHTLQTQQTALLEHMQTQKNYVQQAEATVSKQYAELQSHVNKIHQDHTAANIKLDTLQTGQATLRKEAEQHSDNLSEQQKILLRTSQNNGRQVTELKSSLAEQGKATEAQTQTLDRLHRGMVDQGQVANSHQIEIQKQLTQGHTQLAMTEKRAAELKEQMQSIQQLLTQLTTQLKQTSTEVQQTLHTNQQQDQATDKALQKQLQNLEKAIQNAQKIHQQLSGQLKQLQNTVDGNHRNQSSELNTIKKKLDTKAKQPKNEPEKSKED